MKNLLNSTLLATTIFMGACTGEGETGASKNSDGFVDIKESIPSVQLDIRYHTTQNFTGSSVDGYDAPKCLLTQEAAVALKQVVEELAPNRLSLKIFDCYRPQRAVDHFVKWAKDLGDLKMKSEYYPSVDKKSLFRDGYIAAKSSHSRGSTIDLTIVDLNSDQALDMGTDFDFFDPLSHTDNSRISRAQHDNRVALRSVMQRNGFNGLKEEWWHFTLKEEPYADSYFNFTVR